MRNLTNVIKKLFADSEVVILDGDIRMRFNILANCTVYSARRLRLDLRSERLNRDAITPPPPDTLQDTLMFYGNQRAAEEDLIEAPIHFDTTYAARRGRPVKGDRNPSLKLSNVDWWKLIMSARGAAAGRQNRFTVCYFHLPLDQKSSDRWCENLRTNRIET